MPNTTTSDCHDESPRFERNMLVMHEEQAVMSYTNTDENLVEAGASLSSGSEVGLIQQEFPVPLVLRCAHCPAKPDDIESTTNTNDTISTSNSDDSVSNSLPNANHAAQSQHLNVSPHTLLDDRPKLQRGKKESKKHFQRRKKKAIRDCRPIQSGNETDAHFQERLEKYDSQPKQFERTNIVARVAAYTSQHTQLTKLEKLKVMFVDLGEDSSNLTSIRQHVQVLQHIWVNIHDFLDAKARGDIPIRFRTERQLSSYTRETGKVYPKEATKDDAIWPLCKLLAHIFHK